MIIFYFILSVLLANSVVALDSERSWSNVDWINASVVSHITSGPFARHTEGSRFVGDILKVIHSNQHPPKESCKSRRLLVFHMFQDSLEGMGSVMKDVAIALSYAMHANRTLVWGLGLPFIFSETNPIWAGAERDGITLGNMKINCPHGQFPSYSPFECIFQQLSSCSLDDASPSELIDLPNNPFDHSSRIKFLNLRDSSRRSVAMYHPPAGLIEHISDVRQLPESSKLSFVARGGHLWVSSVAAYVFRLKPEIFSSFHKKHQAYFTGKDTVWGLHVRHGDVRSMHHMIKQKRVFDFNSYFGAARDLSHVMKISPSFLYVSTDSTKADDVPALFQAFEKKSLHIEDDDDDDEDDEDEEEEDDDDDDEDEDDDDYDDDEEDYDDDYVDEDEDDEDIADADDDKDREDVEKLKPLFNQWFGGRTPKVISVDNTQRYRTEQGFVIAASSSCVRVASSGAARGSSNQLCSVPYQSPVMYGGVVYGGREKQADIPRPLRLMRLILEAVEDVFLLSLSDSIVAQGSSHFSTFAATLMWARTGCENVDTSFRILDESTMIPGDTASAFLQGTNLWNSSYVGPGADRWAIHTNRFFGGIDGPTAAGVAIEDLDFDPWEVKYRMGISGGIPQLPERIFYREAAWWLGHDGMKPVWPGDCSIGPRRLKNEELLQYFLDIINLGASHFHWFHDDQTFLCWKEAESLIPRIKVRDPRAVEVFNHAAGVVQANLRFLTKDLVPYQARGKQRIEQMAKEIDDEISRALEMSKRAGRKPGSHSSLLPTQSRHYSFSSSSSSSSSPTTSSSSTSSSSASVPPTTTTPALALSPFLNEMQSRLDRIEKEASLFMKDCEELKTHLVSLLQDI